MQKATVGSTVRIHCITQDRDGVIVESTRKSGPLEFTVGTGTVARCVERAVLGLEPGESTTAEFIAEEAFGPHRQELVFTLARSAFRDAAAPAVGEEVHLRHRRKSKRFTARVIDVSGSTVTLDANHPLAGRDLTLNIEVLEVQ